MSLEERYPKTLKEAMAKYSNESLAFADALKMRWPDGVICPYCVKKNCSFVASRNIWQCKDCRKQFSFKKGTIFEDSPIPVGDWLIAMWLIVNAKNGISSYEVARALGVTQKTAWFMMHRIRLALQNGTIERLTGEVEADETYIGGKAPNMHKWKREKIALAGSKGKTCVFGVLERGGKVIAKVIVKPDQPTVGMHIVKHVDYAATLYTDQHSGYNQLGVIYDHHIIHHAEGYVKGNVHTNGIENFWSLLKRTIKGTYVSISPAHTQRYVSEQVFRFNTRKGNDASRFATALAQIMGIRITYSQLTGKE